MAKLAKLILRAVQLIFMAVILGLSATLVKGQLHGSPPSITVFALVCGIWGALVALVGIVEAFVEALEGIVMLGLDGLATLFFLSGSIAMAVQLGVGSCTGNYPPGYRKDGPNPYCAKRPIIMGGGIVEGDPNGDFFRYQGSANRYVTRCRMAQADVAFLFFGLFSFFAALGLSFMSYRRGGKGVTVYS